MVMGDKGLGTSCSQIDYKVNKIRGDKGRLWVLAVVVLTKGEQGQVFEFPGAIP